MDIPSSSVTPIILHCISGPDLGKRLAVREDDLTLGRSPLCNLLSDDHDVGECHVTFNVKENRPTCRAMGEATFLVDGHRVREAALSHGQQIRIGRSLWEVGFGAPDTGLDGWIDHINTKISDVAGVERLEGFSAREMFSQVLKSRKDDDVEEYFTVGTASTTPPLSAVETSWPKPWAFFKTFTLAVGVYLCFVLAVEQFRNPKLVPGLIITGAFLIPMSLLIFFFEMNVVRNVSLYQVVKLVLLGGILSLLLSLFLFEWTSLGTWLGAMSAGIIEEIGKTAALFLVVYKKKYRWTLNGLLFGAAVGTGFSAFESAGYALVQGLSYGQEAMLEIISLRGLLSMLGLHVIWTSMVGAALWRVRGDRDFSLDMLKDPRFLRILGLAMALHMVWNAPFDLPLHFKHIVLGFIAWTVNLSLVQAGLKEVRRAQQELRAAAS